MIVNDHRSASITAASALALGLSLITIAPALANASENAASPAVPAPSVSAAPLIEVAAPTMDAKVSVGLSVDGRQIVVSSRAETVGAFLADYDIHVAQGDFVSAPLDSLVIDGMDLAYRSSKTLTIAIGSQQRTVHSAAATVGDVLAAAHVAIGPRDIVNPSQDTGPLPETVIRVQRDARTDARVAFVPKHVIETRHPALTHIVRAPRPKIVERSIAAYASLASAAETGFKSILHMAGSAIHMIATAYTASCYGCSGITATGARAGFGIIAVDPSVIPLGTKLFIPGYGRAVAGDTGGAIRGNRVDLGMNTIAQAIRFGRRPITVYVLR